MSFPFHHDLHYENDLPVQIEDRCVNADIAVDYLAAGLPSNHAARLFVADRAVNGRNILWAVRATRHKLRVVNYQRSMSLVCSFVVQLVRVADCSHARLLFPGSRYRLQGRFIS